MPYIDTRRGFPASECVWKPSIRGIVHTLCFMHSSNMDNSWNTADTEKLMLKEDIIRKKIRLVPLSLPSKGKYLIIANDFSLDRQQLKDLIHLR